ncbi:hypothetical protein FA13DRAFT_257255 [Coprinellus micaceus]|uniref:Uncharacterized protein n=1 Tax=Coprinellus micaceus TaxID=71717 RepID=A0A4Y7TEV2_COPMI|nr:hypothetical protein FA13DRAFT_798784 [Coprinellus micaceus]TEB32468.1 hypothetical protein FA13DRAFT_257255 [Coprinellus micaceus]
MVEEKQDMAFVEETDISCLFAFTELKLLTFSVNGRPRVTPQDVTKIVENWPRLQYLDLCGTPPLGQTPYIDHTHPSRILHGCPLLQHLGLPLGQSGCPTVLSPSSRTYALVASPSVQSPEWLRSSDKTSQN